MKRYFQNTIEYINNGDANRIVDILNNKKSNVCVMIKGDWGSGKTYFWKELIEPELKRQIFNKLTSKIGLYFYLPILSILIYEIHRRGIFYTIDWGNISDLKSFSLDKFIIIKSFDWSKFLNIKFFITISFIVFWLLNIIINRRRKRKIIYITLFGKGSYDNILNDIYSQVVFQYSNLFDGILKSLIGVDKVFSSLRKNDFKNTIVCIDDIERKPKTLNIADIMGLANDLRDNKNCHVVLILNQNGLDDDKEIEYLQKNEEKVIDYKFEINDVLSIKRKITVDILNNEQFANILFEESCKYKEFDNIRVYKRMVMFFELLYEEKDMEFTEDKISSILQNIINIIKENGQDIYNIRKSYYTLSIQDDIKI